jgi:hypothetical protein
LRDPAFHNISRYTWTKNWFHWWNQVDWLTRIRSYSRGGPLRSPPLTSFENRYRFSWNSSELGFQHPTILTIAVFGRPKSLAVCIPNSVHYFWINWHNDCSLYRFKLIIWKTSQPPYIDFCATNWLMQGYSAHSLSKAD